MTTKKKGTTALDAALSESKKYANTGYKISAEAISLLEGTIKTVSERIESNIHALQASNINDSAVIKELSEQLTSIKNGFEILPAHLHADLKSLSKNGFSITLFGRTMAGKSTLMEILTHGDGSAIGKGSQRTTRDVRTYTYKNMTVTDVPGTGAFDGGEDDEIAFDAAKESDLVLFMLSDDAPQATDAEWLSKILKLGKPVICIINTKVSIDEGKPLNLKLIHHKFKKAQSPERLADLRSQFVDFGASRGQNWSNLKFVYVHLKSAFLAQQPKWQEYSEELYRLSRFDYLEKAIVNEVTKNGKFYKLKSFTDIVTVPVIDFFEALCRQASENSSQGRILIQKRKSLRKWTDDFISVSHKRVAAFSKSLLGELKREIASFAEDNYDNPDADEQWKKLLDSHNIGSKAAGLLQELADECETQLQEICREINSELKFSHINFKDKTLKMNSIFDSKNVWDWAVTIGSSALTLAGLFISAPFALAGIAVGIVGKLLSFLFPDKEEKIRDARKKLENNLTLNIDKIGKKLQTDMNKVIDNAMTAALLEPTIKELDKAVNSVFTLSEIQWDFSNLLNEKLAEINKVMVKEALKYIGYEELALSVLKVARIPGNSLMLMLEDGARFPDEAVRNLAYLMKETIFFVFDTKNLKSILAQVIGKSIKRDAISIEYIDDKPRIAHISTTYELDPKTLVKVRLAQQMTGLMILK